MRVRRALQSNKRGHTYAFRKQWNNTVMYLVGYKFPMFSIDWTAQGLVAIWIPAGLSSGLPPYHDVTGYQKRDWHLIDYG